MVNYNPISIKPRSKSAHGHKEVIISTRHGEISCDEGIADLIEWLNLFPTVETFFSCQGQSYENKTGCLPYVLFTLSDIEDLNNITKDLGIGQIPYIDLRVDHNYKKEQMNSYLLDTLPAAYRECKLFFHLSFELFNPSRLIEKYAHVTEENLKNMVTFDEIMRITKANLDRKKGLIP